MHGGCWRAWASPTLPARRCSRRWRPNTRCALRTSTTASPIGTTSPEWLSRRKTSWRRSAASTRTRRLALRPGATNTSSPWCRPCPSRRSWRPMLRARALTLQRASPMLHAWFSILSSLPCGCWRLASARPGWTGARTLARSGSAVRCDGRCPRRWFRARHTRRWRRATSRRSSWASQFRRAAPSSSSPCARSRGSGCANASRSTGRSSRRRSATWAQCSGASTTYRRCRRSSRRPG
mmetsp:Transcript_11965/g.37866  ORF Transcript_11965/g.37866 Transcript_11965/m.37866 type:complete len:237 (-) Transcript_11965:39-749(-)